MQTLKTQVSGDVLTRKIDRILYATDASNYSVMPLAVLIPKSIDDVEAAVKLAAEHNIPVLPRASGTSLAGQAVNEALVIDFTRHLDQILDINPEEKSVRVQPGVVLDHLNAALKPHGLKFGPDPASSNRAAMGGIAGNNATGSHSILYGMTADHLLGARAILNDGSHANFFAASPTQISQKINGQGREAEIYRGLQALVENNAELIREKTPKHWRRCGGYNLDRFVDGPSYRTDWQPQFNLAQLLCGSEGTLGVFSELTLSLVDIPKATGLVILQFQNPYHAFEATPVLLETQPDIVEFIDNLALTMCQQTIDYSRLLKTFTRGEPNCLLLLEFSGENGNVVARKIDDLKRFVAQRKIPAEIVPAIDAAVQANVWAVRKAGLGLLMSKRGDFKPVPFIEDAAVPVERLAEYVGAIDKFSAELGTPISYHAHASAGCLHIRPILNLKRNLDIQKMKEISAFAAEQVKMMGGAWSSEHGDGRNRTWQNRAFFGEALYGLYRQVKHIFDPENLFNPGNIVGDNAIEDNLRLRESDEKRLPAFIEFKEDGGFARAVEMCNGAGVCRKHSGSMCPSFMATRKEADSTRGRANALRQAIYGELGADGLSSKEVYEVLDLCVECKACKAECPSSVDMAKLKFEFLNHYHARHGTPMRSMLFANLPRLAPLMATGFGEALINIPFMQKLVAIYFGLTTKRNLPAFVPDHFKKWFKKNGRNLNKNGRKQVVLFHDTWNTYSEPKNLIALATLLSQMGYEILLSNHGCCGRPAISKGVLPQAKSYAKKTIDSLFPFAEKGIPIVGLEPSCLLTLRDEYLYLFPDDEKAQKVAENAFLWDEFLLDHADELRAVAAKIDVDEAVFLHGHCHQKASCGMSVTHQLFEKLGIKMTEIEGACCGMAGSFGYEKEHYEVSMQMANLKLIPGVKSAPDEAEIVAAGYSCRQQVSHGSGRQAEHPVRVIARAVRG